MMTLVFVPLSIITKQNKTKKTTRKPSKHSEDKEKTENVHYSRNVNVLAVRIQCNVTMQNLN